MTMNEVLSLALPEPPGQTIAAPREWEEVCMEEVQRRAEHYERGRATARGWCEALQDIRGRLPRARLLALRILQEAEIDGEATAKW
jgi:hypothetical protein